MSTQDKCCSIVPYFKIKPGESEAFEALSEQCVEKAQQEPGCLYYGFSYCGNEAHCREGYTDAGGVLAHLENVNALLKQLLQIADLTSLEIHGPEEELTKLREPLAALNPKFFTLKCGFRRR